GEITTLRSALAHFAVRSETRTNDRFGSGSDRLLGGRLSGFADCGHARRIGLVRHVPEPDSCSPAQSNHSITSSARASSDGGTPSASALAVLRVNTSSNFVGS